jgi:hypothetical protein
MEQLTGNTVFKNTMSTMHSSCNLQIVFITLPRKALYMISTYY